LLLDFIRLFSGNSNFPSPERSVIDVGGSDDGDEADLCKETAEEELSMLSYTHGGWFTDK